MDIVLPYRAILQGAPQKASEVVAACRKAVPANRILLKDISIVGVHWGQYVAQHPEFLGHTHEVLTAMYLGGQIQPAVGKTFRLEDVPAGLRELAERRIPGKAVAVME